MDDSDYGLGIWHRWDGVLTADGTGQVDTIMLSGNGGQKVYNCRVESCYPVCAMNANLHLLVMVSLLLANLPAAAQTAITPPSTTEQSMNSNPASLGYVILYVRDVSASLAFYENAFGFKRRFFNDDNGKTYGELDTGAARLAFYSLDLVKAELKLPEVVLASPDGPPLGFEIAVLTSDVAGLFARAVGAGAAVVSEPVEKPWGQTVACVRDKDGHLVEIVTPMP